MNQTELDQMNKEEQKRRNSKLIKLQSVIDLINEYDSNCHKQLESRPIEEQRIIGNFVTVLFSEIMQDIKEISTTPKIFTSLLSEIETIDGIKYFHLDMQITKEEYDEFEKTYKND